MTDGVSDGKTTWTMDRTKCDECNFVGSQTAFIDGEEYEVCCVGKLKRKRNPKDKHDRHNRLRFCILDSQIDKASDLDKAEIQGFDWTPYEMQSTAILMMWGVKCLLSERQPRDGGKKT